VAIVKKSASGKAIQFILSETVPAGTVFQLSSYMFDAVMAGTIRGNFVVLSRLPIPVPGSKYPPSVIWGESDKSNLQVAIDSAGVKDVSSAKFLNVRKDQKTAKDTLEVKGDW